MNEGFSGGILGTYIKENYPLYFTNDALIEMFGYERAEFDEKFKENTAQLSYVEDKEFIQKLSIIGENGTEDFSNRSRWIKKDGSLIWVEFRVRKTKDDYGNDIFVSVIMDVFDIVNLQLKAKEQNETIMAGITDYSVIWKPRDIVGGDIYWMKQFETGTVLVVADCTGHGTPGALLTMLVVSALEAAVLPNNCQDTAEIIWNLEQRLVEVFSLKADGHRVDKNDIQDGCDLAVLFIANDGNINLSAGHTNVYVCDGKEVKRIRGQKLYVGEGKIPSKEELKTVYIPHNADNKFYIASNGLSDQSGFESDEPFGYRALGEIALANHNKPLSEIKDIIWEAFEEHRSDVLRVDDFELVAFKP